MDINPTMGEGYTERLREMLPPDDPINEERLLTAYQQLAFPSVMWLVDTHRLRASGRSYLCAIAAIELAMRGHEVHLVDPSIVLTHGVDHYQRHRHFGQLVERVAREKFPRHRFEFRLADHTMRYLGRRPR